MNRENEVVQIAVEEIRKSGAAGDAYHIASDMLELVVSDGLLEKQQVERSEGLGIRVFLNQRTGFSYSTILTPGGIRLAVEQALFLSRCLPPDLETQLPGKPDKPYPELFTEDSGYAHADLKQKVDLVHAIERGARSVDPRVSKFQQSGFQQIRNVVSVANTNGILCQYRSSRAYGSCECAAVDDGGAQVGFATGWARSAVLMDAESIGREAATRAIQKLGARAWTTKSTNVILDPWVSSGILTALSEAFRADYVLRGKSLLVGQMGQSIASKVVTLVDDGVLSDGSASMEFDDEGWPSERTLLVENGRLIGLLHNASSAARMKMRPTGNAARESFTSPPKIGPSNFYMLPGEHSSEDLLRAAGDGLLITETMGLHTIDSVTGEFSIAANGLRITDGSLVEPVNGIAIAGNLIDLMKKVVALGSDRRTFMGGGVACSTLVEGLSVSGS